MKYLILALLFLTGCKTLTIVCRHIAPAQYNAAVEQYGKENVELWRLKNDDPNPYKYHMQAKIKIGGVWYWVPNRHYTECLDKDPQRGCTPYKRLK